MKHSVSDVHLWQAQIQSANFNGNELANLCDLSARQLQRKFRRTLNRSPQDWSNEQRIKEARRLLMGGQKPKPVALELRFKQYPHFCRMFKRYTGITPRAFVAQYCKGANVANG